MVQVIRASAHEVLVNLGYTDLEAKRIRPFLSRRFEMMHQALPRTNFDFWLAYLAAAHYSRNSDERGMFISESASLQRDILVNGRIKYVSDTLNCEFATIEFVRHFGDAIFSDYSPEMDCRVVKRTEANAMVIKNRLLQLALQNVERIAKDSSAARWVPGGPMAKNVVVDFDLPSSESLGAAQIKSIYMSGQLAMEYKPGTASMVVLPNGFTYRDIAAYQMFLWHEKNSGNDHTPDFESQRFNIADNLRRRAPYIYSMDNHFYQSPYFTDNTTIGEDGQLVHTVPLNTPAEWNYFRSPKLVRILTRNGIAVAPTIPAQVRDYFPLADWL